MLAKMARLYPAERTELTGADGDRSRLQTSTCTDRHCQSRAEQRDQLKQVLLALKAQRDSEMQANRGAEVVPSEARLNGL